METGRKQFYDFMLERVQPNRKEDAGALLQDSFARQANGTFTADRAQQFGEKIVPMLKPEAVDEVTAILKQFGPSHTSPAETGEQP